ncbi:MAG: ABC transporter ATP-binding protein, partial [Dehalococcoidia bacterium]|nr:ABC transporter ATP-binding protein [Dehalococcoidia bacterium]
LVVLDEFTSTIDRTVAQIGSAAVAKAVRRTPDKRLVAVTCHEDVEAWLQPEWVYRTDTQAFTWRGVQRRPPIRLEIARVGPEAWHLFRRAHYLSHVLHRASACFLATVEGRPAAFTAVLAFPHPNRPGWREHRTVCLPDFQGVGIGNALSAFVGGLYRVRGRPYRSTTSHPAMIRARLASPDWRIVRRPSMVRQFKWAASNRLTAGFEYVGPAFPDEARQLGVSLKRMRVSAV